MNLFPQSIKRKSSKSRPNSCWPFLRIQKEVSAPIIPSRVLNPRPANGQREAARDVSSTDIPISLLKVIRRRLTCHVMLSFIEILKGNTLYCQTEQKLFLNIFLKWINFINVVRLLDYSIECFVVTLCPLSVQYIKIPSRTLQYLCNTVSQNLYLYVYIYILF